jgi:hypothetical protein
MNKTRGSYFIDTIYDPAFETTYYYVVHELPNGNRNVVSRYFRNHKSAEELKDELNDDLYSEDEGYE